MAKNNKPKKFIPTVEDFELFKAECKYWLKFFAVVEYEVFYEFDKLDNNFAQVAVHVDEGVRNCVITLCNSKCNEEITEKRIKKNAFHEVCELMLWEIGLVIFNAVGAKNERIIIHKMIRRLENTIFEDYCERMGIEG